MISENIMNFILIFIFITIIFLIIKFIFILLKIKNKNINIILLIFYIIILLFIGIPILTINWNEEVEKSRAVANLKYILEFQMEYYSLNKHYSDKFSMLNIDKLPYKNYYYSFHLKNDSLNGIDTNKSESFILEEITEYFEKNIIAVAVTRKNFKYKVITINDKGIIKYYNNYRK